MGAYKGRAIVGQYTPQRFSLFNLDSTEKFSGKGNNRTTMAGPHNWSLRFGLWVDIHYSRDLCNKVKEVMSPRYGVEVPKWKVRTKTLGAVANETIIVNDFWRRSRYGVMIWAHSSRQGILLVITKKINNHNNFLGKKHWRAVDINIRHC